MYTNDNRNLCDLCFMQLPHNVKSCPCCDGKTNISRFPTSMPEGAILMGRYFVGKVLGKGGFGITYLCYDLKEKKKVAIKEYLPGALAHRDTGTAKITTHGGDNDKLFEEGAKKFYDEAKLVSRFNGNPNIISVYEFFNANNTTYFVMEYLSGMDMKKYLKTNGRLPEGEVLYIADRVTEALAVVHSMNTFHRDIAPDNIFLSETGEVKLIDFGAARSVMANESKSLSVILKQGFAPLEQYQRKGKQGPWTDIYALGVTLYLALMGKMPDDAMTRIDDPELDLEGVSPELARIIEKMLAVRAEDRYQNVLTLRQDLGALATPRTPLRIEKEKTISFCKKCGKVIGEGDTLCPDCRRLMERPVPPPPPPPRPASPPPPPPRPAPPPPPPPRPAPPPHEQNKPKKQKRSKATIVLSILLSFAVVLNITLFIVACAFYVEKESYRSDWRDERMENWRLEEECDFFDDYARIKPNTR